MKLCAVYRTGDHRLLFSYRKKNLTRITIRSSSRIARLADSGARSAEVHSLVLAQHSKNKLRSQETPLLKPKTNFVISTFNVLSLSKLNQVSELVYSALQNDIDIICIQEHRFYHPDLDLKYNDVGRGWTLISASAWKNSTNATIGGVGILLSPKAMKCLNNIEKISPRIVAATFNGNPATTVISCYSPTNTSDEQDVITFYDELSALTHHVPKHNILLVAGDLNAHLAQNFSYHDCTNRNGEYLSDYQNENSLLCLGTHFQKPKTKLWTHKSPRGSLAQLDYIFVNKKWKNSALNCQAYNTFEGVKSDHRIVSAKLRLSLRANKSKSAKSPPYDWATLRDEHILHKYSVCLKNRYQALQDLGTSPTPSQKYDNFVEAHEIAAEKHIPLKPKTKKRVPWETAAIQGKRKKVKEAANLKNKNPSQLNERKYKKAIKDLNETYNSEQQEYVQKKINEIESAVYKNQSSIAWKVVNEVSGRKTSQKAKIRANSQEERLQKWKNHFQKLLGTEPNVGNTPIQKIIQEELPIKKENFTKLELEKVKERLKCNKGFGLDKIPPEVWKSGAFDDLLLEWCNNVYNGACIAKWTEGSISPFPKKGDLGVTLNYRGITLTSIASKIYNSLLLNRIQPHIESVLRRNQNGFRKERSTVGQILTVRRIIEGVKAKNLPAVLLFVDFSKAFDSIHRGKMRGILLAYGIPLKIVDGIMALYKNSRAIVRSPDGDTEFFTILAGVLQGDTLAPFLFIICLDYILRTSLDKIKENGLVLNKSTSPRQAINLTDADYADDLALFANSISEARVLLHSLENAAKDIGLHVNATKTEFMSFNEQGSLNTIQGDPLKQVNSFTYLGSNIASSEADVKSRIGKAWGALDKLSPIWKSSLPKKMKRRFFQAAVESVLLYGASAWTLTKNLETKLSGTYTRMLRAALDVSWKDHPTNKYLYGPLPPLIQTISERRLRFAGHCWRAKQEIISDVLFWQPRHGKRKRGRPEKTYIDQMCADAELTVEELKMAMMDRSWWSTRVRQLRLTSTR